MDRHRTETNHVSVHKPTTVPPRPGSGRVPITPTPGRVPRSSAAWRSSSGPSSWTSWWLTTCKCLATNQRVSFPSIISRESDASEVEKRVCQPQTDVLSKTLAVLPNAETQMVQKVPLLLFFLQDPLKHLICPLQSLRTWWYVWWSCSAKQRLRCWTN